MSLDYKLSTYRSARSNKKETTSYGCMSSWMTRQKQTVSLPHASNHVLGTRPILPPAPLGMPSMHDTYLNRSLDHFYPAQTFSLCDADRSGTLEPSNEQKNFLPGGQRSQRAGGGPLNGVSWRHLKEVMQAAGKRTVFVDGQIATKDTILKTLWDSSPIPHRQGSDNSLPQKKPRAISLQSAPGTRQHGPISRYDLIDVRKGLEKHNWSIVR